MPQPGPPPKPKGIDPDSVPSPVTVAALDAKKFESTPYHTNSRLPPPLPETPCQIIDDGKNLELTYKIY